MTVPADLLAILACPVDHGPLQPGSHARAPQALTCGACGRVYPVRDGVPVLLIDEAVAGPDDGAAPAGAV